MRHRSSFFLETAPELRMQVVLTQTGAFGYAPFGWELKGDVDGETVGCF